MAVVIADAGPLIALTKLNQLNLLSSLFGTVLVTQAVIDECFKGPKSEVNLIEQAIQLNTLQCIPSPELTDPLSRSLGDGEKSCITYALQTNDKVLLIMDDALARKQALRFNLTVVGTAALLFTAQHKGFIIDAEILINQLRDLGYRISDHVINLLKSKYKSK